MADDLPSPTERTVVVTQHHLGRLWMLTIFSLVLNALILLLIVIGAIIHHHQRDQEFLAHRGGRGDDSRGQCRMGDGGWRHHFHHFGGPMGMFPPGRKDFGGGPGWGRGDSGGYPGPGSDDRFGGGPEGGGFGRGGFGHGPGGMDSSPGGPGGKMDPAKLTNGILDHLSSQLSLTDDEKTKIKPIIQEQITDLQNQMETQRQAFQKQIEAAKAKIKPLLTPDQQKQLDAVPLPGQKPNPDKSTDQ